VMQQLIILFFERYRGDPHLLFIENL